MKKITALAAGAFIMLVTFSSCQKNKEVVPPTSAAKLTKIEYPATGESQTFTYNSSGRLVTIKNSSFTSNYTPEPFGLETLNSANIKEYGMSNITIANNRVTSYNYSRYNANGTTAWTEANTLEYDANGYQTKFSYPGYIYTSVISGGNTTSQTVTNTSNGSVRTKTVEYYTDKANKLNINFFERWCLSHTLVDSEVMGKKNANLPKKLTDVATNFTYVTEFVYVLDANGLITQVTITDTTTPHAGGTPTVDTYVAKFSYL